ncbi:hypothetical protein XaplCFBP3122_13685 [Xanthomonas arboricola pv. populi]|uniref:Uncharacterized protein n=1 Tax=Xanthomonas arboricola pv. populi TaxID=487823 RepID=A0A2S6Z321_9XANT|nr:hypothetical protein XaplCFBP3122_13685 [Xanthomonas arboricola pv. populi]
MTTDACIRQLAWHQVTYNHACRQSRVTLYTGDAAPDAITFAATISTTLRPCTSRALHCCKSDT